MAIQPLNLSDNNLGTAQYFVVQTPNFFALLFYPYQVVSVKCVRWFFSTHGYGRDNMG